MMGIKRVDGPPIIASMWVTLPIGLAIIIFFSLGNAAVPAWLGVVLAAISYMISAAASTKIFDCPNCNAELTRNS